MNGESCPAWKKVNWWAVAGFLCMLLSSVVTLLILVKVFHLLG